MHPQEQRLRELREKVKAKGVFGAAEATELIDTVLGEDKPEKTPKGLLKEHQVVRKDAAGNVVEGPLSWTQKKWQERDKNMADGTYWEKVGEVEDPEDPTQPPAPTE